MVRIAKILPLLLLVGLMFSCVPPRERTEDIIAANRALDSSFISAYLQGDHGTLMGYYLKSENAVELASEGMLLKGYDAINAYYQNFFSEIEIIDAKLLEQDYKMSGGSVIGSGKYWVKIRSRGEAEQEVVGYYLDVREKHEGKWYYVANAGVVAPPPPAPAPEPKGKKK